MNGERNVALSPRQTVSGGTTVNAEISQSQALWNSMLEKLKALDSHSHRLMIVADRAVGQPPPSPQGPGGTGEAAAAMPVALESRLHFVNDALEGILKTMHGDLQRLERFI